ncbi:unnamed protein product [Paramecium sonneborni]|uniref:Uncharacterized protein n=1 Tax=Paramecium sonneborni TaxID=65129 RepID=A0A8S1KQP5_9CILI|nr:unnamed protein product [Paramecium sonneborni]
MISIQFIFIINNLIFQLSMLFRNSQSRKSIDYYEQHLKQSKAKQKSCGSIKQRRSISKDCECQNIDHLTKNQTQKVSELLKLKDILKYKQNNQVDKENKQFTKNQSSTIKTECQTNYSGFTNSNCRNQIADNNFTLSQQILGHLDQIHQIVQKNERFLTHRSQQDIKDDSFLLQKTKFFKEQNQIQLQQQPKVLLDDSKNHNYNYIIQQQQIQISNLNSKLLNREQKYIRKQSMYEQDIQQLKNQIMQLQNGLEQMKEQVSNQQYKTQFNNKNNNSDQSNK